MSGDVAGATGDPAARWGEGHTVRITTQRCTRCGSRMEEITHRYSKTVVTTRCRGGCRPPEEAPVRKVRR